MSRNALMTPMWRWVVGMAAAVLASCAGDVLASGPIVDAGGFEAWTLPGSLDGQQSWVTTGSTGVATVQTAVAKSGKAIKVNKVANADQRWARVLSPTTPNRFIQVDWDMNVTGTGASAGNFGPIFGVEAYDGQLVANVKLMGALFVDSTTGDVLIQTPNLVETGAVVTFNAWHSYRLLLDFSLSKYSVFVDGARLATASFVDGGTALTDADISALAAGFDAASQQRVGSAYFDNFVVRNGIPGDFDDDGDADAADFAKWKTGFGTTAGGIADSDGDQDSDGVDFLTWQRERGVNLLAATPAAAPVPEPAAATLVALAVGACHVLRSVRRQD